MILELCVQESVEGQRVRCTPPPPPTHTLVWRALRAPRVLVLFSCMQFGVAEVRSIMSTRRGEMDEATRRHVIAEEVRRYRLRLQLRAAGSWDAGPRDGTTVDDVDVSPRPQGATTAMPSTTATASAGRATAPRTARRTPRGGDETKAAARRSSDGGASHSRQGSGSDGVGIGDGKQQAPSVDSGGGSSRPFNAFISGARLNVDMPKLSISPIHVRGRVIMGDDDDDSDGVGRAAEVLEVRTVLCGWRRVVAAALCAWPCLVDARIIMSAWWADGDAHCGGQGGAAKDYRGDVAWIVVACIGVPTACFGG